MHIKKKKAAGFIRQPLLLNRRGRAGFVSKRGLALERASEALRFSAKLFLTRRFSKKPVEAQHGGRSETGRTPRRRDGVRTFMSTPCAQPSAFSPFSAGVAADNGCGWQSRKASRHPRSRYLRLARPLRLGTCQSVATPSALTSPPAAVEAA